MIALFQHHDEWSQKAAPVVASITTQTTDHGTRCFCLVHVDQSVIDISFPHAIKLIPTTRAKDRLPQRLLDYRSAARTAVQNQIREFRDRELSSTAICPIIEVQLNRDNCAVDHALPQSFDRLLYDFTEASSINPLSVVVDSVNGTIATFADRALSLAWESFHAGHARLRLVSSIANSQLRAPSIDWSHLWNE